MSRVSGSTLLAGCLGALVLSSCVMVRWQTRRIYEPVTDEQLEGLRAEEADLRRVLDALGAPLGVQEFRWDEVVLTYGWSRGDQVGVQVSAPVADQFSASFDYNQLDATAPGVVLFLDEELRLVRWRRGLLKDLAEEFGRQPASPPLRPRSAAGEE